jgi:hypothetical protein
MNNSINQHQHLSKVLVDFRLDGVKRDETTDDDFPAVLCDRAELAEDRVLGLTYTRSRFGNQRNDITKSFSLARCSNNLVLYP